MAVLYSLDGLEIRIKENSDFLDSVISLIPPKHYFKNEPDVQSDNAEDRAQTYQPNKRRRLAKQVLKEQKKRAKKLKLHQETLWIALRKFAELPVLPPTAASSNNLELGSEKADYDKNNNSENSKQGVEKVLFSKFEFGEQKKKKKSKKDDKKLVEELETRKKEIGKLKQEDPKKTESWKKVLQKARGEKIKDDPKLLKKSIQRTQKNKKKSEKAWKERIKKVEKSKLDIQKRRAENIQARLEARHKKKAKFF
ncbi:10398_t:CDS:2 [Ambispora leptoticha]|uniref:10398_t:CDS:1 n=1 Tax=Ambispora leptoticha TaxID=144679 RepID=A0A9N9CUV5_9GLOM|nr:10398_t:CDS:2 [Ambispora leptoticha]